jgi:hypothetical protein
MSRLIFLLIFIGLFITGCAVNNPKFFSSIELTNDETYGYTAENPVTIKNADLYNSIGSSYYYLSRLRTEKGNKLQLIEKFSVNNPNYQKPPFPLQNRYTGQPLSYGTGPLLDLYILKPENETDTIRIYINPYLKGEIKVPNGLNFVKE